MDRYISQLWSFFPMTNANISMHVAPLFHPILSICVEVLPTFFASYQKFWTLLSKKINGQRAANDPQTLSMKTDGEGNQLSILIKKRSFTRSRNTDSKLADLGGLGRGWVDPLVDKYRNGIFGHFGWCNPFPDRTVKSHESLHCTPFKRVGGGQSKSFLFGLRKRQQKCICTCNLSLEWGRSSPKCWKWILCWSATHAVDWSIMYWSTTILPMKEPLPHFAFASFWSK